MNRYHTFGIALLLTLAPIGAPAAAQVPALRPAHPQHLPEERAAAYRSPWSYPRMADSAQEEAVLSAVLDQLLLPPPAAARYGPRRVYLYASRMATDSAAPRRRLSKRLLARAVQGGQIAAVLNGPAPRDTMDIWTLQLGQVRQMSADTAYVDANTVATDRNPGAGCGFEARTSIGVYVIRHDNAWLVDRAESQLVADGLLRYPDTARCTKVVPPRPGA